MKQTQTQILKKDKRGIAGLDIARIVIPMLAVIVILGFLIIVIMGSLGDTATNFDAGINNVAYFRNFTTAQVINTSAITSTAPSAITGIDQYLSRCSLTATIVQNRSTGLLVAAGNYTVSGCTIYPNAGLSNSVNNSIWNVSGSYTYSISGQKGSEVTSNVSSAISTFFGNASTWFSLLAVVIIIGIIALVLFYVSRFSGRTGGI